MEGLTDEMPKERWACVEDFIGDTIEPRSGVLGVQDVSSDAFQEGHNASGQSGAGSVLEVGVQNVLACAPQVGVSCPDIHP